MLHVVEDEADELHFAIAVRPGGAIRFGQRTRWRFAGRTGEELEEVDAEYEAKDQQDRGSPEPDVHPAESTESPATAFAATILNI
jgi:hypothetical protein